LYDMDVDEGTRRQGIGSALVVAVADRLAAAGCRQVFLNATGMLTICTATLAFCFLL